MLTATAALISPSIIARSRPASFVRAHGARFLSGSDPYRIAGTNMWYAAYLGADAPIGNRDRLKRELDRLTALGDRQCADSRLAPNSRR